MFSSLSQEISLVVNQTFQFRFPLDESLDELNSAIQIPKYLCTLEKFLKFWRIEPAYAFDN